LRVGVEVPHFSEKISLKKIPKNIQEYEEKHILVSRRDNKAIRARKNDKLRKQTHWGILSNTWRAQAIFEKNKTMW
jgi:hypothetical protein